jgi:hypothetical protein
MKSTSSGDSCARVRTDAERHSVCVRGSGQLFQAAHTMHCNRSACLVTKLLQRSQDLAGLLRGARLGDLAQLLVALRGVRVDGRVSAREGGGGSAACRGPHPIPCLQLLQPLPQLRRLLQREQLDDLATPARARAARSVCRTARDAAHSARTHDACVRACLGRLECVGDCCGDGQLHAAQVVH